MAQLQLINIGIINILILFKVNQIKKSQWVTTLYTWYAITKQIQIPNIGQLKIQLELLIIFLNQVIGILILLHMHQILR